MARIVSTAAAYQHLADVPDGEDRTAVWVRDYEARYPSIFQSYYSGWGKVGRRESAAGRVRELAASIEHREWRARLLVDRVEASLRAHELLDDAAVSAVLLVGVGTSNGWVARWEGAPTLFLALELLPDLPYDHVLVVHEMTHLAHERAARGIWPETVGTRVFAEGLASAVSARVVPGLRLDEYLWFDDAHRTWLGDCEERKFEIRDAVLTDLGLDEGLGDRFFSAGPERCAGLPIRSGYWIGLLALQRLLAAEPGRSARGLLRWDADTATERLATAMYQMWP
jgi:hypothetical protein